MNIKTQISNFVDLVLEDSEYFLVEMEVKGTERFPKLFIYLDGDNGISIGKCSEVSREVNKYIEEQEMITTEYGIDVSSPGLERPLVYERQYKRNIGKKVRVKTSEPKPTEGILMSCDDKEISVEVVKGKNKIIEVVSWKDIIETKVLVTF